MPPDALASFAGVGHMLDLAVEAIRPSPAYRFPSPRARAAVEKYDVTSVTVLAVKPG